MKCRLGHNFVEALRSNWNKKIFVLFYYIVPMKDITYQAYQPILHQAKK